MTYMKSGQPFLYDDETGDIVGFRNTDTGAETMIPRTSTDASGNTVLMWPDEEYELVSFPHWPIQVPAAANATTSALGNLLGGIGDVLGKVDCIVNTVGATATLSVQDGTTGETYTLSPSGGIAVAGYYSYDLGYTALVGPWRIMCGAGLSAVANLL